MTKEENLLKQRRAGSKEQENCQHFGLHKPEKELMLQTLMEMKMLMKKQGRQ